MAESTAAMEPRSPATPWFPFLAGPIVGALHEAIGYLLVARSCATGFPGFSAGSLGGLQILELALSVVAEVVLVAAAINGLRLWRRTEGRAADASTSNDQRTAAGRVRFMALVGGVMSIGFALYVLYAGLAAVILNPCMFL